jgi:inorganic pyrophosphatase
MEQLNPFSQWRPHPWHGLRAGANAPELVNAYIEMTPFDTLKYEVDKENGYLRVDRPQRTSALLPALYGFIPMTFCADHVAKLSPAASGGDGDPLDICVISERPINRAEVLLTGRVVGGIQMVDDDEADDKIVAVLANDDVWGAARSIRDLPDALVSRLVHYFETYKLIPGEHHVVSIEAVYDRDHAHSVVEAALADYQDSYGT